MHVIYTPYNLYYFVFAGSKSAYATFKSSQVNTSTMKDTYLDRDNLNYISYALYNDVKVNDPRFIKEIVSLANLAGSVIACLTGNDLIYTCTFSYNSSI
jgi:hypothetical protein